MSNFETSAPTPRTAEDFLAACPPHVGERIEAVRMDTASLSAASQGHYLAGESLRADREDAKSSLARARAHYAEQPTPALERDIAALERDLARRNQLLADHGQKGDLESARYQKASTQKEKVERWLVGNKGGRIPEAALVNVKRPKQGWDDGIAAAIAIWLGQIAKRRDIVEKSVPDNVTVEKTIADWVRQTGQRANGKLSVSRFIRGAEAGNVPVLPMVAAPFEPSRFNPHEQPRMIDVEALLCRYCPNEIRADLLDMLDNEYAAVDPELILEPDEKRRRLAELNRDIDRQGREIAEMIWAARDEGYHIDFPENLPVAALLGVAA